MKQVSQKVKQASVQPFMEQGLPVEFLRDPSANKDEMARAIATQRGVASGLVCALLKAPPNSAVFLVDGASNDQFTPHSGKNCQQFCQPTKARKNQAAL